MVFSSSLFLLYFLPIFLIVYYATPHKFRNWIILAASIFFYSWGAPKFVFVVIGSVILDFYIIKKMHIIKKLLIKKWLLALSISINVGLLLFFKYANFFVENVNGVLSGIGFTHFKWTEIILPIGISFYTFQTLTYSIDVYRKVHEPLKTVKDYLVYIMLFPQMIAGPIVRFNKIADQIENRQDLETIDNKLLGFFRFVIGLAKKVLIANVMGAQADNIFSFSGDELTTSLAWIGIVAYSLQIYFDFSGYSDMAIGIGRMIGFKFPENFNNPYISRSISEFWRRWHITLSSWMRDYLYIPLGGSRVNNSYRLYFNLWIVFLISGLWHGAAWNFVIWGAYHGLFLILDKMFLLKVLGKIGKYPSIIFTHFVTLVGWVIFRAESYEQVKFYLSKMFVADMSGETIYFDAKFWSIMLIGLIFSFIVAFKPGERLQNIVFYTDFKIKGIIVMAVVSVVLLLLSIGSITSSGFNPFIYFRF